MRITLHVLLAEIISLCKIDDRGYILNLRLQLWSMYSGQFASLSFSQLKYEKFRIRIRNGWLACHLLFKGFAQQSLISLSLSLSLVQEFFTSEDNPQCAGTLQLVYVMCASVS